MQALNRNHSNDSNYLFSLTSDKKVGGRKFEKLVKYQRRGRCIDQPSELLMNIELEHKVSPQS